MFESHTRVIAKLRESAKGWTSHGFRWDSDLMSEPSQPPEAELLERLRTERRPKLSVRAAADMAGMSDARWRQIAKGFKYEAGGIRVPAHAPATTLARMAKVVGATPEQLREAGRDDAAAELERSMTVREVAAPADGRRGDIDQTNLPPLDEPYASLLDTLDSVLRIAQDAVREPWVANSKEGLKTVAEAQNALTNFRTMLALEQLRRRDQHAAGVVPLRPTAGPAAPPAEHLADAARSGSSEGRRLRDAQDRETEAGDQPQEDDQS